MFLVISNPALKCVEPHIMESCLFSIGPTVILNKYFFQQKRTYPIKIIFLTLGVGGGGILLPAISGSFQPCPTHSGFVQAAGGPAYFCWPPGTIFFPRTINLFLFPQRCFWQHLRCDLGRRISMRCCLRGHLLWSLSHPTTNMVLHLWLLWLWVRGAFEKSLRL